MTWAPPPPPPQPRRPVRTFLLIGILVIVIVIGLVVAVGVFYATRPIELLDPIGQPTPGSTSAPTTSTPTATRSFSTVPDTAGPAKGEAQVFTGLLRDEGLTCSDDRTDDRVVYSRGCYRTGPGHTVAVEFRGPPNGTLSRVEIDVNYIGAPDARTSRADHDNLVRLFARAAALPERDATTIKTALTNDIEKFTIAWGNGNLQRTTASSKTELRRNNWRYPIRQAATLPGTLAQVTTFATQRGYTCKPEQYTTACTKQLGIDDSDGKLQISARIGSTPNALTQLHVQADTRQPDAPDRATQEQSAILDALGGPRSTTLKQWFAQYRTHPNAKSYVANMHATITAGDPTYHQGFTTFTIHSPCWPDQVGFC